MSEGDDASDGKKLQTGSKDDEDTSDQDKKVLPRREGRLLELIERHLDELKTSREDLAQREKKFDKEAAKKQELIERHSEASHNPSRDSPLIGSTVRLFLSAAGESSGVGVLFSDSGFIGAGGVCSFVGDKSLGLNLDGIVVSFPGGGHSKICSIGGVVCGHPRVSPEDWKQQYIIKMLKKLSTVSPKIDRIISLLEVQKSSSKNWVLKAEQHFSSASKYSLIALPVIVWLSMGLSGGEFCDLMILRIEKLTLEIKQEVLDFRKGKEDKTEAKEKGITVDQLLAERKKAAEDALAAEKAVEVEAARVAAEAVRVAAESARVAAEAAREAAEAAKDAAEAAKEAAEKWWWRWLPFCG